MALNIIHCKTDQFQLETTPDHSASTVYLRFVGAFDENVRMRKATEYLSRSRSDFKRAVLDVGELNYMNSAGSLEWMLLLQDLQRMSFECSFSRMSSVFFDRAQVTPKLLGSPIFAVTSFEAPFRCPACGKLDTKTLRPSEITVENDVPRFPKFSCGGCQKEMELDDSPAMFSAFMRRLQNV